MYSHSLLYHHPDAYKSLKYRLLRLHNELVNYICHYSCGIGL